MERSDAPAPEGDLLRAMRREWSRVLEREAAPLPPLRSPAQLLAMSRSRIPVLSSPWLKTTGERRTQGTR